MTKYTCLDSGIEFKTQNKYLLLLEFVKKLACIPYKENGHADYNAILCEAEMLLKKINEI